MADSEEKLCRLVSELDRVCERRKLRLNVVNSKVMRCSGYGNGGRMHVILNGEPLEDVDCFKYLNRGFGINAKKCLYEGVIVPMALYGAEARGMRSAERRKVNVLEMKCLRVWLECREWTELEMKRCV